MPVVLRGIDRGLGEADLPRHIDPRDCAFLCNVENPVQRVMAGKRGGHAICQGLVVAA